MVIDFYKRKKGAMPMAVLDKTRKDEIEKRVNEIIDRNNLNVPGFDLAKFLTEVEGFQIGSLPMSDNTTGMLFMNDNRFVLETNSHRLIIVNDNLPFNENRSKRHRFIVAHEYAHSQLHKSPDHSTYAHRDADKLNTPQELEADYFARCLLMPKNLVKSFLDLDFLKDATLDEKISAVARVFNVTHKKAQQRLKEDLNYVS